MARENLGASIASLAIQGGSAVHGGQANGSMMHDRGATRYGMTLMAGGGVQVSAPGNTSRRRVADTDPVTRR